MTALRNLDGESHIAININSLDNHGAIETGSKCCPAEFIIALNNKTSYRVISNVILDGVLISDLSDSAVRVWLVVYQHCWGDNRGGRAMSATYIAARLSKSKSTIDRALKELRDNGFLVSTRQSDDNDNNKPRLLSARIPTLIAEEGIKSKQRKPRELPEPQAEVITSQHGLACEQTNALPKKLIAVPNNVKRISPKIALKERAKLTRKEQLELYDALKRSPQPPLDNDKRGGINNDTQTTNTININNNPVLAVIKFSEPTKDKIIERLKLNGFIGSPALLLLKQIEFACSNGIFADKKGWEGINICLKLIRLNKWRTPWGYQ